jgi:hypothetical protein
MQWEGKTYSPVKGTPWISESQQPVSSVVRALGLGGDIAHTVIAAFSLHYPANAGTNALDAMAGALMDKFRPGTGLSYGGDTATILQVERRSNTQEPDWINGTVIVTMVGHTSNP